MSYLLYIYNPDRGHARRCCTFICFMFYIYICALYDKSMFYSICVCFIFSMYLFYSIEVEQPMSSLLPQCPYMAHVLTNMMPAFFQRTWLGAFQHWCCKPTQLYGSWTSVCRCCIHKTCFWVTCFNNIMPASGFIKINGIGRAFVLNK